MLRRSFIISFSITIILFGLLITNLFILKNDDYIEFSKFKEQVNTNSKSSNASQLRQNVRKDIYITQDNNRQHFYLHSKHSKIFLNQKNQKYAFFEKLGDIECIYQDKIELNGNSENIKYFTAQSGTYYFPSHKFCADDVSIAFLETNNIDNIDLKNAYLKGQADSISFSLSDSKKPQFKANSFKAYFYPKRDLLCD